MEKKEEPLTWKEFMRLDMRVGTVLTAEVFKEARNPSYKLTVDFGELGVKKSSAQITKRYTLQELVGKQVIAVVNFPPKQIATMMSECLILGAIGNQNVVTLVTADKKVANGQRIG
ncbi:tRNA-binding protein [Aquimarina sp. W85]|uniref:tRNA-binding protein n=1 Tax=Aquimarina rhodophyticola TaxID=3342246 RepID=UPI00366D113A